MEASLVRSYLARDKVGLLLDALSASAYGHLVELGGDEVWRAMAYDFHVPGEVLSDAST